MAIRKLEQQEYKQIYIKKFKKTEIEEIHKYITSVYSETDGGYVRLFSSSTGSWLNLTMESVWDLNNFKRSLNYIGKEDTMYSLNLFKNHQTGLKKDLQAIRMIAIDIDFKAKGEHRQALKENVLYLLEQDYFKQNIPEPSIVESGNQVRLIYVLEETVGVTQQSKMLTDRIHKVFAERLSEFGAEPHKLTSFARIPNSINTKTGDIITVTNYTDYRYSLKELQEDWLNPLPDWYVPWKEKKRLEQLEKNNKKSSKKNKGRLVNLFSKSELKKGTKEELQQYYKYTLNTSRIADLEQIQEYYKFELEHDKEYLCFLYRNHCLLTGMDKKDAEQKTKEFYLKFKTGTEHKWRKIESQTRNVERKPYFIPNRHILDYLNVSSTEEEELGLLVTISKKEKRRRDFTKRRESRRNSKGLTPREQQKQDSIKAVQELKTQGLSQSQVAKKLDKGIATIKRYWNV